jgi:hypothetical protein
VVGVSEGRRVGGELVVGSPVGISDGSADGALVSVVGAEEAVGAGLVNATAVGAGDSISSSPRTAMAKRSERSNKDQRNLMTKHVLNFSTLITVLGKWQRKFNFKCQGRSRLDLIISNVRAEVVWI